MYRSTDRFLALKRAGFFASSGATEMLKTPSKAFTLSPLDARKWRGLLPRTGTRLIRRFPELCRWLDRRKPSETKNSPPTRPTGQRGPSRSGHLEGSEHPMQAHKPGAGGSFLVKREQFSIMPLTQYLSRLKSEFSYPFSPVRA